MTASVNGTQIGHDTLASMAFSWGEMIAYASRGTWVMPGSVLGSGTCGGG
jgi:2-keto-4-pentenoate hydratase/2-oxohepta-3-ene-1,7-dioic acid hydratase in catechol pathway